MPNRSAQRIRNSPFDVRELVSAATDGEAANEGAAPLLPVKESLVDQLQNRLPHRHPADAIAPGEIPFRWNRLFRGPFARPHLFAKDFAKAGIEEQLTAAADTCHTWLLLLAGAHQVGYWYGGLDQCRAV